MLALGSQEESSGSGRLKPDRTGWNGVIFLQSDTAVPRRTVEAPMTTPAERERFAAEAKAGGWKFELAWFWVEP